MTETSHSASGVATLNATTLWQELQERPQDLAAYDFLVADLKIDDPFSAVNVGIMLRMSHRYDEAEHVYRSILGVESDYIFANYELGFMLALRHRWPEATHFAKAAARQAPDNLRFQEVYACLLALLGNQRGALACLDRFRPRSLAEYGTLVEIIQFVRFLDGRSAAATLTEIEASAASGAFLTTEKVEALVYAATSERRPFAMVRMGDGEGAWTIAGNCEEATFPELYQANRRSFLHDWFGSAQLMTSEAFYKFARELTEDLKSADVVGLPEANRMRDEFASLSRRGVPSCINLLRTFGVIDGEKASGPRPSLCSANIHIDLMHAGFFERLIGTHDRFGLVTSYRNLPEVLRARGSEVAHTHFVPGDSRNFWQTDGTPDCQFPDHYERVMAELSRGDHGGVIYLVAAGYVGKRYCTEIKRRGGIALDIGAIANRWADGLWPG